jgi:hypothetical protein
LPRPTLVGVHHAAGGNPFYALELTRFLLEEAKPPGPGDPLPVPPTLEELLRARITRLPKATRDALEVAALLSEPTLAALGALEGAGAGPGWLDRAVAGGVVELVDDRVRFTHPLLAAAVSSTMGPGRRRRLHARLAELELDPEERARHLALATTGPDGAVAEALEAAAQHAVLRGAPASAAELAELAAQRTPQDDQERRWRRTIEAGLRHATAGDFARARALLEPLLGELPPGPLRGEVLLNLADIGWDDDLERISLAERALVEIDDDVSRAQYGTVTVQAWGGLHPTQQRHPGHGSRGPRPIVRGTILRVQVERVPARTRPPRVLWLWWAGPSELDLDLAWRAYVRRFDLEHSVRFCKQTLGWTTPRPRHPAQADRWTWLVLAAYTQLRLVRQAVDDQQLPWERPRPQPRLSPYRVRRGFPRLLCALGSPAAAPKPSGCSPGRPRGRASGPAVRHPALKKPRNRLPRTERAA